MPEAVVGWDLGGAHLKVVLVGAAGEARAVLQLPCPLWHGVDQLERAIDDACRRLPAEAAVHAVTMTGEMADLFVDRAHGVEQLVTVLQRKLPGARIKVFAGRHGFVAAQDAAAAWRDVASANWLATAMFAARRIGDGVLVDVGSTTTDVIPFAGGAVCARGIDDRTRLAVKELVYTGVVRTPVMAMAARLPFVGDWIEPMAEHFATAADVYRLTGELPEDADLGATADGRGKSLEESVRRLARMIGCDADVDAPPAAWTALAEYIAERQVRRLHDACVRVLSGSTAGADAPLIGAGIGSFVARKAAQRLARRYVDFSELVATDGVDAARVTACAPAFAVACLVQSNPELNPPFDKGGQGGFTTDAKVRNVHIPLNPPFSKGEGNRACFEACQLNGFRASVRSGVSFPAKARTKPHGPNPPFEKGGQGGFAAVSQCSELSYPPQSPFFKGGRQPRLLCHGVGRTVIAPSVGLIRPPRQWRMPREYNHSFRAPVEGWSSVLMNRCVPWVCI